MNKSKQEFETRQKQIIDIFGLDMYHNNMFIHHLAYEYASNDLTIEQQLVEALKVLLECKIDHEAALVKYEQMKPLVYVKKPS